MTSECPDIWKSKCLDVKKSGNEFRHKTTMYLNAHQYELLEAEYTKRRIEGRRCDRYSLVGEAIEIAFRKV